MASSSADSTYKAVVAVAATLDGRELEGAEQHKF